MVKKAGRRGTAGGGTVGLERATGTIAHFHFSTQPQHGQVNGDTWHKSARASAHMLHCPRAWAVDCQDLDAAERCGARFVCIQDLESLQEHWAHVETIRRYGFALERGFGRQVALGLDRWARSKAEAAPADGVQQMTLWEVRHG